MRFKIHNQKLNQDSYYNINHDNKDHKILVKLISEINELYEYKKNYFFKKILKNKNIHISEKLTYEVICLKCKKLSNKIRYRTKKVFNKQVYTQNGYTDITIIN